MGKPRENNILSLINRVITSHGYNTALGIHHSNMKNPFNLGCDFMEPFRPLVDKLVFSLNENELTFEVRNISYYESEIQKINLAEVNAKNVSVLPLKKKDFQKLKTIKGTPVEMSLLTDNIVNL